MIEKCSRYLVPDFDGVLFSEEWQEALWDKFYTAAPSVTYAYTNLIPK